MWRMRTLRKIGVAAAVSTIAATGLLASSARADEDAQPVKAVWQVQEIYLSYFGFTTFYSCDGLLDRVRAMITVLGANEKSIVTSAGCVELNAPERLPGARIILATPRAATPEVVAANAKDEKRAALLAKLQHKGGPALETGEFDAVRKTVVLNSKEPNAVGASGDCELVEHMRDQVIKKMDARVVKDQLGCVPHQGTVGNRTLQVEVLVKA
jgi:hypothetical protein